MNSKKTLSIIIIMSCLLSLFGCKKGNDVPSDQETTFNTQEVESSNTKPIDEEPYYFETSPFPELPEELGDVPYFLNSYGDWGEGAFLHFSYNDGINAQDDIVIRIDSEGTIQQKFSIKDMIPSPYERVVSIASDISGILFILVSSSDRNPVYTLYSMNQEGQISDSSILLDREYKDDRDSVSYTKMLISRDGQIYLRGNVSSQQDYYGVVDIFDNKGSFIHSITEDYHNPLTAVRFSHFLVESSDGVYIGAEDSKSQNISFYKVDFQTENLDVTNSEFSGTGYIYSHKKIIYATDGQGLFCLNNSGTDNNLLLTWSDLGITQQGDIKVILLSENIMLLCRYSLDTTGETQSLYEWKQIRKVSGEKPKEKTILRIGGLLVSENPTVWDAKKIFEEIYLDYQIEFIDYSPSEEEWDKALNDKAAHRKIANEVRNKMNMDIITGSGPDIILDDLLFADFPLYAKKEVLTNLSDYIEKDPDFSKENYFPMLFPSNQDEIFYLFASCSSYQGIVVKKSIFDSIDSWTLSNIELFFLTGDRQEVTTNSLSYTTILTDYLYQTSSGIRDASIAETFSENGELSMVLSFAKKYGKPIESITEDVDMYNAFTATSDVAKGVLSFQIHHGALVNKENWNRTCFEMDNSLLHVPFPSPTETLLKEPTFHFLPYDMLGISEYSLYKDIAWEFIKIMLGEEVQDKLGSRPYGYFPVRKSSFDQGIENFMKQEDRLYGSLSRKDANDLRDILSNASVYFYNVRVMDILIEESGAFFSGDKTLEQTLNIMQDRVSTFINTL